MPGTVNRMPGTDKSTSARIHGDVCGPTDRPSHTQRPREIRMPEPTKCRELNYIELNSLKKDKSKVLGMQMQLFQLLESALESGCVVMVDSVEHPDWRPAENNPITNATKATRWAAFGNLVALIGASLRRAYPSSSTSLCSSSSPSATRCKV